MTPEQEVVAWDFGGTLIPDGWPAIGGGANAYFASNGRPRLTVDQLKGGPSAYAWLTIGGMEPTDTNIAGLNGAIDARVRRGYVTLVPGAKEALQAVLDHGDVNYPATMFEDSTLAALMETLGLRPFFAEGITVMGAARELGDQYATRKADVPKYKQHAVGKFADGRKVRGMVGDLEGDIATGKAVGAARSILIRHNGDTPQTAADKIVFSLDEAVKELYA